MGRTLILIGGSRLQLPALRWAREAGLEVCLTDRDPGAPGRRHADRFHALAGDDVEGLVALALEIARKGELAGAYCSNDFGLAAVAAIGEATGTPANAPAAVRQSLDKAAATEVWRRHGVPTTTGRVLEPGDDANAALAELGLPCIVKPADSSGSRGVVTVADEDEARAALERAFALSPRAVVERPLEGLHLDVNGFFRDGAFVPGGILERYFSPPPHHVPQWGVQPARLEGGQECAVYRLVENAARALELVVGPVKADVVWSATGPAVLELAPRFHGDVSTAHVTPLAHGKSPIQAWFATLAGAGGPFDEMPLNGETAAHEETPPGDEVAGDPRAAGWMALFPQEAGTLGEVHGLEAARRLPGIEAVTLRRPRGHTITSLTDNTAVCGFLWASGRDAAEVESRLRAARALIEVRMTWRSAA